MPRAARNSRARRGDATLSEADTRAKLIDPALHTRGWTEDLKGREVAEALAALRKTLA